MLDARSLDTRLAGIDPDLDGVVHRPAAAERITSRNRSHYLLMGTSSLR
jgi:hypothetical protein